MSITERCKCRHTRAHHHGVAGCQAGDWRMKRDNSQAVWTWCPCARFQQAVGISLEDHLAYVEQVGAES